MEKSPNRLAAGASFSVWVAKGDQIANRRKRPFKLLRHNEVWKCEYNLEAGCTLNPYQRSNGVATIIVPNSDTRPTARFRRTVSFDALCEIDVRKLLPAGSFITTQASNPQLSKAAGSGGGQRRDGEPRPREQCANLDVPVAMLSRAEIYEKKAAECEREGDRAASPALKSKYRGVAQEWREMAEQEKRSAVKRQKKSSGAASVS